MKLAIINGVYSAFYVNFKLTYFRQKCRLLMQPALIVYCSFFIPNIFRSKNPIILGLLNTTTFIAPASYYVQHLISAIPNATIMTATINSIKPVGQKQEITNPRPNATAYAPEKQLCSFPHRILSTTQTELRLSSLLS